MFLKSKENRQTIGTSLPVFLFNRKEPFLVFLILRLTYFIIKNLGGEEYGGYICVDIIMVESVLFEVNQEVILKGNPIKGIQYWQVLLSVF